MMKKFIALLLVVSSILCFVCVSYAAEVKNGIESSNITFVDDLGYPVSALIKEQITAKVTVRNTDSDLLNPVLLVCSYQNNKLNGVWYKSSDASIAGGNSAEISVPFTPVTTEDTVIKATVVDSMINLNAPIASAQMLENSISLDSIIIGGQRLLEYSDDVDEYFVKVSGEDINVTANASDGGTKVDIVQASAIPGNAEVKLTAADGTSRNIALTIYNDEEQLYSLTNLCYEINGERFVIEDFDPSITEYKVELPQNTFYVTVVPEAPAIADTAVFVSDINHMGKTFGGVSYFLGTSYVHRTGERRAIDNIVPIKNEETDAVVSVTSQGNQKKYNIKFTCQQPRLTEFNLGDGTYQENEKPYFISGAALNNDNGTAVGADRQTWTLGGIGGPIVGASMISLASVTSGRDASSWQKTNTSGEWCSFRADTDGTAYFVSSVSFANTDYYNESNGWERVDIGSYTKLEDGVSLKVNEDSETYCIFNIQWGNQADSFTEDGVLNPVGVSAGVYGNVYKKSFKAGELVSIHHPGKNDAFANGCGEVAIVWDLPQE